MLRCPDSEKQHNDVHMPYERGHTSVIICAHGTVGFWVLDTEVMIVLTYSALISIIVFFFWRADESRLFAKMFGETSTKTWRAAR
jgi:hypothetical protein